MLLPLSFARAHALPGARRMSRAALPRLLHMSCPTTVLVHRCGSRRRKRHSRRPHGKSSPRGPVDTGTGLRGRRRVRGSLHRASLQRLDREAEGTTKEETDHAGRWERAELPFGDIYVLH